MTLPHLNTCTSHAHHLLQTHSPLNQSNVHNHQHSTRFSFISSSHPRPSTPIPVSDTAPDENHHTLTLQACREARTHPSSVSDKGAVEWFSFIQSTYTAGSGGTIIIQSHSSSTRLLPSRDSLVLHL
jgi:hypothetical protein